MFSNKYLFFTLISIVFSLFYKQLFGAAQTFGRTDWMITCFFFVVIGRYVYSRGITSQQGLVDTIAEHVDTVPKGTGVTSKTSRLPIGLITSNPGKVQSFQEILNHISLPFEIEMLEGDYVEDKTLGTTEGVVLAGAQACAKKYGRAVLVQDTGLFINALQGFPGINTKYALQTIGNEGILQLLSGQEDRACTRMFSLGFCTLKGEPKAFTGTVSGTISTSLRGNQGFGFDPIFIPDGYSKTFGEDIKLRDTLSPFNQTVKEFADWYSHHV